MPEPRKESRLDEFISRPRRALFSLALPVLFGMAIQTTYMLVDMIFVGRVSSQALTALAFNMPLVFLAIGIIFGLGAGVTSIIARFIGARDKRGADSSAEHAVALGLLVSAVITILALQFGRGLLSALGVPPEILPLAWDYLSVLALGYVFLVMSVFFRSILSGEGDMKTPMMIQGAGTLLNIALDPVCIFTLDLGVQGAALATVISQAVAAGAFVYLLFFKEHAYVTFDLKDFQFSWSIMGSIFRVGAPASVSFVIMALGGAVFNRILITFSADTVAAFQVGARLDQIFMLPMIALGAGLMTLVGMFHGAARSDLVRQTLFYTMTRGVAVAVVMGTLFFLFAPQLVGLFTGNEAIRLVGTGYLRISVLAYPFLGVAMLGGRALQGMGLGAPLLVITLMRVILISAPLAYVFVFWMDRPVEWVWASFVIGMVATALVSLLWLKVALRRSDPRSLEIIGIDGVATSETS